MGCNASSESDRSSQGTPRHAQQRHATGIATYRKKIGKQSSLEATEPRRPSMDSNASNPFAVSPRTPQQQHHTRTHISSPAPQATYTNNTNTSSRRRSTKILSSPTSSTRASPRRRSIYLEHDDDDPSEGGGDTVAIHQGRTATTHRSSSATSMSPRLRGSGLVFPENNTSDDSENSDSANHASQTTRQCRRRANSRKAKGSGRYVANLLQQTSSYGRFCDSNDEDSDHGGMSLHSPVSPNLGGFSLPGQPQIFGILNDPVQDRRDQQMHRMTQATLGQSQNPTTITGTGVLFSGPGNHSKILRGDSASSGSSSTAPSTTFNQRLLGGSTSTRPAGETSQEGGHLAHRSSVMGDTGTGEDSSRKCSLVGSPLPGQSLTFLVNPKSSPRKPSSNSSSTLGSPMVPPPARSPPGTNSPQTTNRSSPRFTLNAL